MTPLSKHHFTGSKCRLALRANIKGSCYVPLLLLCIPLQRGLYCSRLVIVLREGVLVVFILCVRIPLDCPFSRIDAVFLKGYRVCHKL